MMSMDLTLGPLRLMSIHGRLPLSHPGSGFPNREGEPPCSDAQKPLGFEAWWLLSPIRGERERGKWARPNPYHACVFSCGANSIIISSFGVSNRSLIPKPSLSHRGVIRQMGSLIPDRFQEADDIFSVRK